jgi:hypothetical protein
MARSDVVPWDPEVCVKVLRIVLRWVLRAINHRSVGINQRLTVSTLQTDRFIERETTVIAHRRVKAEDPTDANRAALRDFLKPAIPGVFPDEETTAAGRLGQKRSLLSAAWSQSVRA